MKTADPGIPGEWSIFQYSLWSQAIFTNIQGFQTEAEVHTAAETYLTRAGMAHVTMKAVSTISSQYSQSWVFKILIGAGIS